MDKSLVKELIDQIQSGKANNYVISTFNGKDKSSNAIYGSAIEAMIMLVNIENNVKEACKQSDVDFERLKTITQKEYAKSSTNSFRRIQEEK